MANGKPGRPKGLPRTGGRQKGVRNKANAAREAAIAASGLTPLDYMLSVLRDEAQGLETRLDAAKSAAPYVHPKLANIDLNANHSGTVVIAAGPTDERI